MKRHTSKNKAILIAAASMLGFLSVLSSIANVQAAELQVLAGGAMTEPLRTNRSAIRENVWT
jgi:hypothetical protein